MKRKTGSAKASVTLSTSTQHLRLTVLPTNGGLCYKHQHPDLIIDNRVVLETSKEEGSALFQRFIQQSCQNNLDERKAVWKVLDRTLTEAGSNDNLIKEPEFTEALSRVNEDTAPGLEMVKYSDTKNLSADYENKFFTLYEESFATGRFPGIGHIVT